MVQGRPVGTGRQGTGWENCPPPQVQLHLELKGHSQFLAEEGETRALGLLPVPAAYSGEVPPGLFA